MADTDLLDYAGVRYYDGKIKQFIDGAYVDQTSNETIGGTKTFSSSPLVPVPSDDSSQQAAPAVWVHDQLRANVEALTSGRNTIVRDKRGNPHVMVVVPKFRLSDIDPAWSSDVHPAFVAGGAEKSEVLIGKYIASQNGGKVQTLPGKVPWAFINFNNALAACRELGAGFCLNTNAMWSARVLWDYKCLGGSHEYLGNCNYGRDSSRHELTGTMKSGSYTPGDTSLQDAATLTGTGGPLWNDDADDSGIADLVGNVWEWVGGLRLNDGEIQVIPNNDASLASCDMTAASTEWKAVLQDGALVAPGTADTLKYDGSVPDTKTSWSDAGNFLLNTEIINQNDKGYYGVDFKNMTAYTGVTIPDILKQLAIFPIANTLQGHAWACNKTERLPCRGGSWHNGAYAGPFALALRDARSASSRFVGFRAAFVAS